jgi:Adenosine-deaminase (editase) domain
MNENEKENDDDLRTKHNPTATLTTDNVETVALPPSSNNKFLGHDELIGEAEDARTTTTTRAFRLAEKRRTSTCAFANRVARISIDHYQRHVPMAFRCTQKQTCLSTLVAHEKETNELHVLAMGVGTKFLTQQTLQLELEEQHQQQTSAGEQAGHHDHPHVYGSRVRDGHAEVLCRRAFRRYLTESILMAKQRRAQQSNECVINIKGDNKKQEPLPFFILQPMGETTNITPREDESTFSVGCDDLSCCSSHWQLSSGITLHAYCSSAPCGNAVLKKFTSMKREVFCPDLNNDTWPRQIHAPMLGHAIRMGEFALLLKKDRSRGGGGVCIGGSVCIGIGSSSNGGKAGVEHDQEEGSKLRSKVPNTEGFTPPSATTTAPLSSSSSSSSSWPARQSTNWCPPGTTTVWAAESDQHAEESGSLHTCSDKLCRWNCLGWQGSLLSSFIPLPIHVETITVGRKLSAVCCRRAVCCRIERQQQQPTSNHEKHDMTATDAGQVRGDNVGGGTSSADRRRRSKRKNNIVYLTLPYKVNHPAILGTDVYMDETGMIEVSSLSGAEEGQDVRFHSSVCWAWWPGLDTAETINGTTGFAMTSDDGSTNNNQDNSAIIDKKSTSLSRVSTASLVELFLQARDFVESAELKTAPPVSLSELREFKHRMSPVYENAKDMLLKKHPVLRQWKRRAPSNTC